MQLIRGACCRPSLLLELHSCQMLEPLVIKTHRNNPPIWVPRAITLWLLNPVTIAPWLSELGLGLSRAQPWQHWRSFFSPTHDFQPVRTEGSKMVGDSIIILQVVLVVYRKYFKTNSTLGVVNKSLLVKYDCVSYFKLSKLYWGKVSQSMAPLFLTPDREVSFSISWFHWHLFLSVLYLHSTFCFSLLIWHLLLLLFIWPLALHSLVSRFMHTFSCKKKGAELVCGFNLPNWFPSKLNSRLYKYIHKIM